MKRSKSFTHISLVSSLSFTMLAEVTQREAYTPLIDSLLPGSQGLNAKNIDTPLLRWNFRFLFEELEWSGCLGKS